ncbi:DUF5362 domain-containing protein [Metallibacterium sp.]|uniref:DUF5362 domain-containing protein n=1 Tax=Metallibacterium sp. TaxID=2940281 RepID=UPI00262D94EE|nr:DUF5362 domain-containing protein [Metallibacterium sp.]
MDDRNALVRDLSLPLASGKGWVKFVGIINIITGVLTALSIVGILWAWIPIWMGVLLMQSGGAIERAQMAGDESALRMALDKLRVYFIIQGVLFIIGLVVMALFFVLFFGALMAAIANHNVYNM